MKHTKRILAIMLAALFLVAMVPTAFAANEKLTLTCDKDQFEFTVYKVATLVLQTQPQARTQFTLQTTM